MLVDFIHTTERVTQNRELYLLMIFSRKKRVKKWGEGCCLSTTGRSNILSVDAWEIYLSVSINVHTASDGCSFKQWEPKTLHPPGTRRVYVPSRWLDVVIAM